jgi:hypothetical protein
LNDSLKYEIQPSRETLNIVYDLDVKSESLTEDGREQVEILKELCKTSFD